MTATRIPKRLHQIWIGPRPAPQRLLDSWRQLYEPLGWEYRLWTSEHEFRPGQPWRLQKVIDRMSEWNGKADVMRLEILHEVGGLCVDADSEALHPIPDSFLDAACFAAWEHETHVPGTIATGTIASEPYGRLVFDVLDEIERRSGEEGWERLPAWRSVGPEVFTRLAKLHPELVIHPAKAFIPEHYCGTPPAPYDGPIYARQYFGSTVHSAWFRYKGLSSA